MRNLKAEELKKISEQLRHLQEEMEHMTPLEAAQVGIGILKLRKELKENKGNKEE